MSSDRTNKSKLYSYKNVESLVYESIIFV